MCFPGLCKPHWRYSRACHRRTWSQDRPHRSLSLVLGVFVFSCIFIFFHAILRVCYILYYECANFSLFNIFARCVRRAFDYV